ncbi:cilia- and flagella-associated protein 70-like [Thalassophryne amazonica]|uniref:cilia- and flagella-associated protein 70-like n=1 Tax=Thalassophryne amazonica TaxID=390379 RepID=UPI001470C6E6|nr:cilia- and flagella-associated protein 70-like [Thalassophryne amazonica]
MWPETPVRVRAVKDLIPPKPPISELTAEKVEQNFHYEVSNVVASVLDQYEELFGTRGEESEYCTKEQMKVQLMAALNVSGRYFTFKEQMKDSVVRLVRDRMQRTEPITDHQELQVFLTELYVYLVDEMHKALNKISVNDCEDSPFMFQLNSSQLMHFAREAQINGDYQKAAHYYQEPDDVWDPGDDL